jgi:hypothetical protein
MLAFDANFNTWRLRQQRWERVAIAKQSPQRQQMAIASDPAHHQVIAFGGYPPLTRIPRASPGTNDTWIWNGSTWQLHRAPIARTPPPPPPAPQTCTLNGSALVAGGPRTEGTAIHLSVSDLFAVAPCHLTVSIRLLLIDDAGHPLPVNGNPATANFNAEVPAATAVLTGAWTWTSPCAPSGGVTAQIQATGQGAFPTPIPIAVPAPRCARPTTSTLTADPLTVQQ